MTATKVQSASEQASLDEPKGLLSSGARWWYLMAAVALLAGLILSVLSLKVHQDASYASGASKSFCSISDTLNCDAVIQSKWSVIFGIPLASYGIFFYLAGLSLFGLLRRGSTGSQLKGLDIALCITGAASVLSVALFLLSHFVIGALCPLCMGLYLVNFILLLCAWAAGRTDFNGASRAVGGRLGTGVAATLAAPLRLLTFLSEGAEERSLAISVYIRLGVALCVTLVMPTLLLLLHITMNPTLGSSPRPAGIKRSVTTQTRLPLNFPASPYLPFKELVDSGALKDYLIGDPKASIAIVEFADLECPYCRELFVKLKPVLARYEDSLFFVYKNFPLSKQCNPMIQHDGHPFSCDLAAFSRCAGEQGMYWDSLSAIVSDSMFLGLTDEASLKRAFDQLSDQLELDGPAMSSCLSANRTVQAIRRDVEQGLELKIAGTPTVFINGKQVQKPTTEYIEAVIKKLLEKK